VLPLDGSRLGTFNRAVNAVWFRARAELRRRWRATTALACLIGLAGGVVLITAAGARRSSTAYERFRQETLAADLDFTPSTLDPALFAEVARLPEVEVLARTAFPFIRPQGSDLYPYLDFLVALGPDGKFGTLIDRPRMTRGRMPDPGRTDEFAIIERFAAERGLSVGDRLAFESYAPSQVEALFGSGEPVEPAGPVVTLTVTGVIEAPYFLSESEASFQPRAFLTPAFYREYGGRIGVYEGGASLRLRRGEADVPSVMAAVRNIYRDDAELELQPASEVDDKINDSLQVAVVALLLCAAGAGLAGVVAVGQALGRHLSQSSADQGPLAAVGMGRRQRIAAMTAAVAPAAVGGGLLAIAVAIAGSPLMPVGLARRAEPDLGVSVDGTVLGLGFLGVVVIVAGLATLAAWQASQSTTFADRSAASARGRPSALLRIVTAARLSPAGTTGVQMALEPGRGRTAVPVRSALAGVVLGVVGVVAVATFAASLTSLVDTSGSYGFPWDVTVAGFGGDIVREHADDLTADPTVRDLGTVATSLAQIGDEDVNIHAFETIKGSVAPTLLEGRPAARADEVVLGSRTLRDSGAALGDTIEMTGPEESVRLRVVGRAAFPILDERSAVDRGAALTRQGLESLAAPETINLDLLIAWSPGVDESAANRRLEEQTGAQVFPARLPAQVNNLELVEGLPRALAAFLAILAIVALIHSLVSTVQRRRHDLAVLRTLGFVGAQLSATVAWQATAFVAMGLVIGVPVGIATGRAAWELVASSMGVAEQPSTPFFMLGLVGLVTVVMANLVAALPARMARVIRPAAVLRTG
jgi:hypothetical protein